MSDDTTGNQRLDRALRTYAEGEVTAWAAARMAGINLWVFLDELERRGRWFLTDEETIREQIRSYD